MKGTELEQIIRSIVREELERVLRGDATAANDDEDIKRLALARAVVMRRARRGGGQ